MCTDFNFVWYYVIFQVNIMGEEVDLLLEVSEHFPCLFIHGSDLNNLMKLVFVR